MGEIKLRGQKYWIRYYRDGRRFEESCGTGKHEDAKRLLRLREGDVERGLPVSPKIGRLRFEDAAIDLINDYKANRRKTLKDTQRRVDLHLAKFFGGRRMSSISTSDVRAYIAKRQDDVIEWGKEGERQSRPVSSGEINRELTALKRMFRLALQAGKLYAAPHIPMLRENNVRTGFFEWEQFEAVRRHLPEYAQPIVTFAYYTGWRITSEVQPLEWRQVDFEAGTVRLDAGTTKNGEGRVFVFGFVDELRELLEGQRASVKELARTRNKIVPSVFHRNGAKVKSIRKSWANACVAAGCPGRMLHDFRRTAVRNLVRAGIPERVAMTMTGHKTRSVFERYNIVSDGDLREAGQRLSAFVARERAKSPKAFAR
jgi:integrase